MSSAKASPATTASATASAATTTPSPSTKAASAASTRTSAKARPRAAAPLPAASTRAHATAQSPAADPLPAACSAGTIFNINGNPLGSGTGSTLVGNIYALDTATGDNTLVGRFLPAGQSTTIQFNGLAVTPSLSAAYAVTQNGGGTVWIHLRDGTNASQSTGATGTTPAMVMGAVNPVTGIYYYAGYTGTAAAGTRALGIWGFNPALAGSARVLGQVASVPMTGTPQSGFVTGDLAFDASGHMFFVAGTNNTGATAVNTSQIRRVNGTLPVTPQSPPVTLTSTLLATNAAGPPGSGFYNGIAFATDGTLYAQYATTGTATLVDLNPNSGTILFSRPQTGVPASGILTDLAGCSLPGTLTLRKDLPNGRARPGDQFTMTITGGGITEGNTATTTGSASGIQSEQVGPRLAVPSTSYTISESLVGPAGGIGNYTSSWSCTDTNTGAGVASGTGTSGTFSFPSPDTAIEGANVVCTFTNTPLPPGIRVVKTAQPGSFAVAGEHITYTFVVTNTGNVTLTGITLVDSHLGDITSSCPHTTLAPGADMTCTVMYTITQADVDADIHNTVTVTGHPPTGPPVTDEDSATVTFTPAPGIRVVKTAQPGSFAVAGEHITYTFVVTNTGNVPLTGITLVDSHLGDITSSCPHTTLAAGADMTCTVMYTTTAADVGADIHNTVTVTGHPPTGPPVTDEDSATVTFTPAPGISVVKSAHPDTYSAAGEHITYTFVVTNTGNVELTGITLIDTKLGNITSSCPHTTLAAGADMTCTVMYTITQADVDAGHIHNVATVTGHPPTGPPVTDEDSVTVTAIHKPGIEIEKTASPTTFTGPGQTITYTFRVTNVGNVTLHNVTVTDSRLGTITCPHTTLAASAEMTCTATHITTQADVDRGEILNVAIARGTTPEGTPVTSPPAEAKVTARVPPTPPKPPVRPPLPEVPVTG